MTDTVHHHHFQIPIVHSAVPCENDQAMLRLQLEGELSIVKNLKFIDGDASVEMHFDVVSDDPVDAVMQCVLEAVRKYHSGMKDIRYQGLSLGS